MNTTDELTESIAFVARESAKMNPVPPKQPKKKQRNIRVSDWLWEQVEVKAAERGESASEYVRRALERAVED